MTSTRRGLLVAAGAGMAGLVAARTEAVEARRRRQCTMGDIDRLERMIRDLNARLVNMQARLTNTGFGPGAMPWLEAFDDSNGEFYLRAAGGDGQTEYLTAFPGSVIAISAIAESNYAGAAGSNYNTFTVHVNGVATGLSASIAGGSRSGQTVQEKGLDTFAAGDRLQVYLSHSGTPVPSVLSHQILVWVSYT